MNFFHRMSLVLQFTYM